MRSQHTGRWLIFMLVRVKEAIIFDIISIHHHVLNVREYHSLISYHDSGKEGSLQVERGGGGEKKKAVI